MDIHAFFVTDDAAETDGVWQEFGDAKFLVARSGNRKYTKLLSDVVAKHKKMLDTKTPEAEALSEKLMIEVMAKTVLLDWDGVLFKGEALPYSYENAVMLLSIKDFRRQVSTWADDMEQYRVERLEEQRKN